MNFSSIGAWFQTDIGRRVTKGFMVVAGALLQSGILPMDTPLLFGFSLSQVLIFAGILTPTGQMNKGSILNRSLS